MHRTKLWVPSGCDCLHTLGHVERYPEPTIKNSGLEAVQVVAVKGNSSTHQHIQHHTKTLWDGGGDKTPSTHLFRLPCNTRGLNNEKATLMNINVIPYTPAPIL